MENEIKERLLIDGVEITLGGQAFIMPAIPLIKAPSLNPVMKGSPDPLADPVYVTAFVDSVYWSLRRNYPDIGQQFVAENVDIKNYLELLQALVNANGLGTSKANNAGEASPQ